MFYVYLLASRPFGTLYIGMTADLVKRVWEHKAKAIPGFAAQYGIDQLVWYESMRHWNQPLSASGNSRSGSAGGRSS